jgi:hypothetical protein
MILVCGCTGCEFCFQAFAPDTGGRELFEFLRSLCWVSIARSEVDIHGEARIVLCEKNTIGPQDIPRLSTSSSRRLRMGERIGRTSQAFTCSSADAGRIRSSRTSDAAAIVGSACLGCMELRWAVRRGPVRLVAGLVLAINTLTDQVFINIAGGAARDYFAICLAVCRK